LRSLFGADFLTDCSNDLCCHFGYDLLIGALDHNSCQRFRAAVSKYEPAAVAELTLDFCHAACYGRQGAQIGFATNAYVFQDLRKPLKALQHCRKRLFGFRTDTCQLQASEQAVSCSAQTKVHNVARLFATQTYSISQHGADDCSIANVTPNDLDSGFSESDFQSQVTHACGDNRRRIQSMLRLEILCPQIERCIAVSNLSLIIGENCAIGVAIERHPHLGAARKDELAQRITAVLSAPNRVSVFSDLRRQRERTTGLRNRAARARGTLIDSEAQARGNRQGEVARIRSRRQELQAAVMKMPVETEDFTDRDLEKLEEYRLAERELQGLRVEILGLEARVVASRTGLASVDPEKVDPNALRAQIDQHEADIQQYEEQLTWIRRRLEVGRLHVGVGDKRYQADDAERSKFIELVERERELAGSSGPAYNAAFSRVAAVERQLDQRDAEVAAMVRRRVSGMLVVVDEETANLARYRAALGSLEGETEDVVGAITYLNFNRVHERFYDLVLRADLGKIDVSWARREDHRLRIDGLTRERARELQALDDEFRDVMDEGQGSEGEP